MYEFNFFALSSLFASGAYFILGSYILYLNPKNLNNKLFFMVCLSMSIWGLGEGMHRAALSMDTAMPWAIYVVGLGSAMHTIMIVHFWLNFSGSLKKFKYKFLALLSVYAPFIFFTLVRFFNTEAMITGMSLEYWGYSAVVTSFYSLYTVFLTVYTLFIAISAIRKFRASKKKDRRKYLYIGIGILIPVAIGTVTQLLRPLLHLPLPEMTMISSISFISAIAYAVKKYGLLTIDIGVVAENIVNDINELVIAVNPDLRINFVNKAVCEISKFNREELIRASLQKIIKGEFSLLNYNDILKRLPLNSYDIDFILKDNSSITLSANISAIKDKQGFVFLLRDTREIGRLIKNLKEQNTELERFNKLVVDRELQMVHLKEEIVELKNKLN